MRDKLEKLLNILADADATKQRINDILSAMDQAQRVIDQAAGDGAAMREREQELDKREAMLDQRAQALDAKDSELNQRLGKAEQVLANWRSESEAAQADVLAQGEKAQALLKRQDKLAAWIKSADRQLKVKTEQAAALDKKMQAKRDILKQLAEA